MRRLTEDQYRAAREIAREFPAIHDRLMRAGLIETAKLFREGPQQRIGYEIAEHASQEARQA